MVSKHPGPSIHRLIGNIAAKVEWQNLNLPPVIASETEERHSGDPPAGGDSRISQDGRDPGQARLAAKRARMTKREIAAGSPSPRNDKLIVGFENHGGRTYLGENAKPFAKVVKGYGNNGEDGTEGVVYKNAMGCYFHGPLLPKNPHIADWLIQKSLEVKYKEAIKLETLDDSLEWRAHQAILEKLSITRRL
ncbi:MAG: hypothetical protein HY431_00010 [Candidatus Levybacteria bacterium]|nr:hypothetical protein [Candidatus Levybacteria bacterium]